MESSDGRPGSETSISELCWERGRDGGMEQGEGKKKGKMSIRRETEGSSVRGSL